MGNSVRCVFTLKKLLSGVLHEFLNAVTARKGQMTHYTGITVLCDRLHQAGSPLFTFGSFGQSHWFVSASDKLCGLL